MRAPAASVARRASRVLRAELSEPARCASRSAAACSRGPAASGRRLSRSGRYPRDDRRVRHRRPPGRRARRGRSADPCAASTARTGRGIAARSRVGVLVTAVGSSRPAANARTEAVAHELTLTTRWTAATAFATGPHPVSPRPRICCGAAAPAAWSSRPGSWRTARSSIASRHSLAHNRFRCHPLGAHRQVAETVLDRFDQELAARVAA